MPEISRFYGIIIRMYWSDHVPPHFHAIYGEYVAEIVIETFAIKKGYLPPKALALVVEWASIHKNELLENWQNAQNITPFKKIAPLN